MAEPTDFAIKDTNCNQFFVCSFNEIKECSYNYLVFFTEITPIQNSQWFQEVVCRLDLNNFWYTDYFSHKLLLELEFLRTKTVMLRAHGLGQSIATSRRAKHGIILSYITHSKLFKCLSSTN